MTEKLKSYLENDRIFYGFLLFLVGVVSFYCGRFSVLPQTERVRSEATKAPISTEISSSTPTSRVATSPLVGNVVASKSGTKYHLVHCPGAKSIKAENLISFNSTAEAEAAGYKRAQNCP